jgi:hypothetical protein
MYNSQSRRIRRTTPPPKKKDPGINKTTALDPKALCSDRRRNAAPQTTSPGILAHVLRCKLQDGTVISRTYSHCLNKTKYHSELPYIKTGKGYWKQDKDNSAGYHNSSILEEILLQYLEYSQ